MMGFAYTSYYHLVDPTDDTKWSFIHHLVHRTDDANSLYTIRYL